jgi:hypothetical protein
MAGVRHGRGMLCVNPPLFCLGSKEMTDKRSRRTALEITETRQMTGNWLTIITKMMITIGPNGSILTAQMNLGSF